MKAEHHYFGCSCFSNEHLFKFMYFPLDKKEKHPCPELYLEVFLFNHRSMFKRIWTAVKYIFKHKSRFGDWDETMLETKDVKRLKNLCERFLEDVKQNNNLQRISPTKKNKSSNN